MDECAVGVLSASAMPVTRSLESWAMSDGVRSAATRTVPDGEVGERYFVEIDAEVGQ
jgi:hypothetical protein